MKAERRHELKDNTLAKGLMKLPNFAVQYGIKIGLAILAVALIGLFIYQRTEKAHADAEAAAESLRTAHSLVAELSALDMIASNPELYASERTRVKDKARDIIDQLLNNSVDRHIIAEAYIARGDLNWILANMKPLPGAATRPSLALDREPSDYLQTADDSYQRVLEQYRDQKMAVISAYFGRAAVAQNRHDYEKASRYLNDGILNDTQVAIPFRRQAQVQLNEMTNFLTPTLIGAATAPSSTQPAKTPAAPTTAPSR